MRHMMRHTGRYRRHNHRERGLWPFVVMGAGVVFVWRFLRRESDADTA